VQGQEEKQDSQRDVQTLGGATEWVKRKQQSQHTTALNVKATK
jgi:hypothetical protein